MPKVFEEAGFIGRFYMADLDEPMHVHITKDHKEAKFWLAPVSCARNGGFSSRDLPRAEDLVNKYLEDIVIVWQKAEEARKNAGRAS